MVKEWKEVSTVRSTGRQVDAAINVAVYTFNAAGSKIESVDVFVQTPKYLHAFGLNCTQPPSPRTSCGAPGGPAMPPPAMVTMSLPSSAPILAKFAPSPPQPAYQRDEATHCFEFDTTGMPSYVRGMAQGFWYFEGPVVPSPGVSVLSLYANGPNSNEAPIIGTLSLQYSTDYMSATVASVSCSPTSWCSLWPTQLINGSASPASYTSEAYCLWNATATRGTAADLTSEWTSSQGTTYMCSTPTATQANAVSGSWLYINGATECASRGRSYPCTNNNGPYNIDSVTARLPDGGGVLITQARATRSNQVDAPARGVIS